MTGLLDRVKCFTNATGPSDATVGAAFSTKHMTPAEAGAIDGRSYVWLYEQGNDFELVRGVWTAISSTAARTSVLWAKASGTVSQTKLSLSGTATVSIVAAAEDLVLLQPPVAKSGSFTVVVGDRDTLFLCSGTGTVTMPAAATAGNLFKVRFINVGTGQIALPDGAGTAVLWPGESAEVECDGSNYYGARGRVRTARGADIASAATLNLDAATGDLVDITGTVTVTAITLADGKEQWARAAGVFTLTENSVIDLNGAGSNVTLAVGDRIHFRGYSGGVVKAWVTRVSGAPVVETATGTALRTAANSAAVRTLIDAQAIDQCVLVKNGSNLELQRMNGRYLFINGALELVPATPITLAPTGLTPGTSYLIFAYMNAGTMTLEASTAGAVVDSTYGHFVKFGDATRSLVGFARPVTGPAWVNTATQRLVRSWYNRDKPTLNVTIAGALSTAAGPVEIDSSARLEFLVWDGEGVSASLSATVFTVTPPNTAGTNIAFDGTVGECEVYTRIPEGSIAFGAATSCHKSGLSVGYHYVTATGHHVSGTSTNTQWQSGAKLSAQIN